MKNHYKFLNEVLIEWNESDNNNWGILSTSSIKNSIAPPKKFLTLEEYYNDFMPLLRKVEIYPKSGYLTLKDRIDYSIRDGGDYNVELIDYFLDFETNYFPSDMIKEFEDALIKSHNKISTEKYTKGLKMYPLHVGINKIFKTELKDRDRYYTPSVNSSEWEKLKEEIEEFFINEKLSKIFNKIDKLKTKYPTNDRVQNGFNCITYCQGYLKTGQYIIMFIDIPIFLNQMQYGHDNNELSWPATWGISIWAVTDIISNYQNEKWFKEKYLNQ